MALANVEVVPHGAERQLPEDDLRRLLENASQYQRLTDRLASRRLDTRVIDAAVWSGAPREQHLADEQGLRESVAPGIDARLRESDGDGATPDWDYPADPEHGGFRLVAATWRQGKQLITPLDTDFLRSSDFLHLVELADHISAIGAAPFRVVRAGAEREGGTAVPRHRGEGSLHPALQGSR
ncbi:MAG: hypothetical protein ACYS0K_24120 [Planctomycetota bacterium]